MAYQNNPEFQKITAQQIFGAKTINGVLPVTISDLYKFGSGINLDKINILSYSDPEKVGVDRFKLSKIDSIVEYAIENGMTPGAQVLVAKNSNIIYEKSFGKLRYNEGLKTDNQTIYDLASLTKILVTTPILIKLVDEGVIKLETKIKDIIPRYIDSNKSEITIKELLSGHASLQAWIPFYKFTLDENKKPSLDYYSYNKTKNNSLKVAPNLFLRSDYIDTIRKMINNENVSIGAQDCSMNLSGAFTGEVSAPMLLDIGCKYIIVGHSERRNGKDESNKDVYLKAKNVIDNKMIPIICVGESLKDREAGKALQFIESQLKESIPINTENREFIIAYEPIWAIGSGKIPTIDSINEILNMIRQWLLNNGIRNNTKILYGGSLNKGNTKELFSCKNLGGLLIGGVSLKAEEFSEICLMAG